MFFTHEDGRYFLRRLGFCAREAELLIIAYCLMPNHTHLIVIPQHEDSLTKAFQPLHLGYSQRINQRMEHMGRNWQGRFFSSPMDEQHTVAAIRYILENPLRAKIARTITDYPWSSAAGHLGHVPDGLITAPQPWRKIASQITEKILRDVGFCQDEIVVAKIRRMTAANLPTGNSDFVERLEQAYGRRLALGRAGR